MIRGPVKVSETVTPSNFMEVLEGLEVPFELLPSFLNYSRIRTAGPYFWCPLVAILRTSSEVPNTETSVVDFHRHSEISEKGVEKIMIAADREFFFNPLRARMLLALGLNTRWDWFVSLFYRPSSIAIA